MGSRDVVKLIKRKEGSYNGQVKDSKGLLYDNCSQTSDVGALFDPKHIAKADDLKNELLTLVKLHGFDVTGRKIFPSRLYSSQKSKCPPQNPHVDWMYPNQFFDMKKDQLPLACLFPTTTDGCWLQIWPAPGYGRILRLEFGEVMFFLPYVIHGGGLGRGCPRVQAYITKDEAVYITQYKETESNKQFSDFCFSSVELTKHKNKKKP
jgi:hypothetical protein